MNFETIRIIAGYLGGILTVIGTVIYLRDIYRGKVESNKVTWGIWTIVTIMLTVFYYEQNGFVPVIWVSIAYIASALLSFLFSMWFTKISVWTWVEKFALVGVAIIFVLWLKFHSPLMALTLTGIIDIIGFIPLLVHLYKNPGIEAPTGWIFGFSANAVNLIAVEAWDYANSAYPIYLALMTFTAMVLTLRKVKKV